MSENLHANSYQSLSGESSEGHSSEQLKLTNKQRLGRLLMITELKDKTLVPDLIKIKNEMYENFCRTGVWKSEYINKIFRLYADKNQNINILKPQFQLFSQYTVSIPDVPETEALRVTQYIKVLKFIRNGLSPTTDILLSLVSDAKRSASNTVETENDQASYTMYDIEDQKQKEHMLAKKHLEAGMEQEGYTQEWFLAQEKMISSHMDAQNYQVLMEFALLGFHYFGKRSAVYDAFSSQQFDTFMVSFTLPGFHPTSISLGTFLTIIEHLDFKKHIFSV